MTGLTTIAKPSVLLCIPNSGLLSAKTNSLQHVWGNDMEHAHHLNIIFCLWEIHKYNGSWPNWKTIQDSRVCVCLKKTQPVFVQSQPCGSHKAASMPLFLIHWFRLSGYNGRSNNISVATTPCVNKMQCPDLIKKKHLTLTRRPVRGH